MAPIPKLKAETLKQIRTYLEKDRVAWTSTADTGQHLKLSEPTPPTPIEIPADSNVELSWEVFGGDFDEPYYAVLLERCIRDGLESLESLTRQFQLHLHRGIGYLASSNKIRSISDLVALTAKAK